MDRKDKQFGLFAGAVVLALVAIAAVNLIQARNARPIAHSLAYSQFLDDVDQGRVRSVTLTGQSIEGYLTDHTLFQTYGVDDPDLIKNLRRAGITIAAVAPPAASNSGSGFWSSLLPLLVLVAIGWFFMRRMPGMGGGSSLGKSRARLLSQAQGRITFAEVAGVDEARDSLQEIVDFLREPQKFQHLGGRIPRGVLLVGPPGTGKTLLARAIAGEAGVPFFTISGSDFVEMFVGIGASRVRAMFEQAKKSAPCIIFMDEIDAVGRRRGVGTGGGNDEREQTLNQLLVEMDGFESSARIILIAATNRPDVLDPALLRPGRFDREIVVDNPDVGGREQILAVHLRGIPLEPLVDLKLIARGTPGFSGADLMNLVNEAALLAARRGKQQVGSREFEDAKDNVTMGAERRTHVMTESEKKLIAYREGGRAVVALRMPASDPLHKVTIVTRGRTTGLIKQLPEHDQLALNLAQMRAQLAVLMSGRAAEEMIFGPDQVTSGTAPDIEQATDLARKMVMCWGLSDQLGPVFYRGNGDVDSYSPSAERQHDIPEQIGQIIAAEVRRLIEEGQASARALLARHRAEVTLVAEGLLIHETLSGAEIQDLLAGREIPQGV